MGSIFVKLFLNLEPVVEEEISLKYISYLQHWWSFGLLSKTICAILLEDITGNIHMICF